MKFIRFIKETTFVVTRNDKTIIEMPTLMFALLMLFFWQALVPVLIIAVGDFSKEDHGSAGSE